MAAIRAVVPTLEEDRHMADDLAAAIAPVASGAPGATATPGMLPFLPD